MRPAAASVRYQSHTSVTVIASREPAVSSAGSAPAGHGAELDLGLIAGLLDRQYPVPPNHDAPAATLGVPALEDERLQTGRDGADAESSQLAIPQKGLPLFRRREGVDRTFRQLAHSQLAICSDFAYTTT